MHIYAFFAIAQVHACNYRYAIRIMCTCYVTSASAPASDASAFESVSIYAHLQLNLHLHVSAHDLHSACVTSYASCVIQKIISYSPTIDRPNVQSRR